jgi:polysaccharide deacetylase 2 family uncharacterized protein YibQ
MARGFLSGVVLGGVVSVGAAGVISVLAPPLTSPQVSDAVTAVAAPDRPTQADSGKTASGRDATLITTPASAQTPAPDRDTLALDEATLSTAAQPQTGAAENLAAPAANAQTGGVDLQGEAPVLPNPLALAPMAPEAADELSISTEPAQPPQPATEAVSGAFSDPAQPQAETLEDTSLPVAQTSVEPDPEVVPTIDAQDSADAAPVEEAAAAPVISDAPEQPTTAQTDETPAGSDPVTPDEGIEDAPDDVTANTDTPSQTAGRVTTPAFPQPAPADQQTASLSIGTPGVSLLERDNGVAIRRPAGAATAVTVADDVPQGQRARPIEQFAQAFAPDGDKPLMSIVLIDDGTSATNGAAGIAALRSFPYPLSFAVDSALPDAAERIARLRSEGFEVLAMVELPQGAQASDVETTFAATFAQLPEIIGVLEGPLASQQTGREVSDQVAAYLGQSGHGWVTQAKGLNTAATLARKEGVPAKPIFRDFDSKGQTAVVIRRFLDQAAFKAGQEGGVIMLGRLRPETISALLLWGLQDRAGQVSLAPVSAVLLSDD